MTNDERELLSAYFVNQGLRLDTEVLAARQLLYTTKSKRACTALYDAIQRKEDFNKFQHDVCALLNF